MAVLVFQVLKSLVVLIAYSMADRYLGGTSEHYMPLQWAQKMCIHGLIQYKWPEH